LGNSAEISMALLHEKACASMFPERTPQLQMTVFDMNLIGWPRLALQIVVQLSLKIDLWDIT
jgi:hypothetical protein